MIYEQSPVKTFTIQRGIKQERLVDVNVTEVEIFGLEYEKNIVLRKRSIKTRTARSHIFT